MSDYYCFVSVDQSLDPPDHPNTLPPRQSMSQMIPDMSFVSNDYESECRIKKKINFSLFMKYAKREFQIYVNHKKRRECGDDGGYSILKRGFSNSTFFFLVGFGGSSLQRCIKIENINCYHYNLLGFHSKIKVWERKI